MTEKRISTDVLLEAVSLRQQELIQEYIDKIQELSRQIVPPLDALTETTGCVNDHSVRVAVITKQQVEVAQELAKISQEVIDSAQAQIKTIERLTKLVGLEPE